MNKVYDLVIVGGGAGGLFSAAYIGRRMTDAGKPMRVALLERGKRTGRKLAVTGNGTCNISHVPVLPENYHGGEPNFPMQALKAFPPAVCMDFFRSIGVETHVREDGRVYPDCLQASAVLDCLRAELLHSGVEELCETEVTALMPQNDGWRVDTDKGLFRAKKVIVAAGGAASPGVGGCTNGYGLLKAQGCAASPLFPTVVPVKTDTTFVRAVKGIRVDAVVRFCLNERTASEAGGEILFTEYGLSGPAVMQASRPVGEWERQKKGEMAAVIDLFPHLTQEKLICRLTARRQLRGRLAEDWLTGFMNKRLGQTLLRVGGIPLTLPLAEISDKQVKSVANYCKGWKLAVTGTSGFGPAQVTAGGISTAAFNPETLEHRLHRGLYAIGEVLDVDGDCGGYNLQWAWSSAMAAANDILKVQGIL